ncbi:Zinc transporter 77C [Carabus blaptoides fortunei]
MSNLICDLFTYTYVLNHIWMSMKEWVQRFQPVQLYLMLALTIAFFLAELVVSHVTHALTLLMDSYHMLCNIIALSGCIITIKYGNKKESTDQLSDSSSVGEELKSTACTDAATKHPKVQSIQETTLKNTFGWARIDVIFMLICCVFLASLCFSLIVEALQTLVHINHQDEMHYPIPVMCLGATGILLNGICYLLIGGYTFHQGSFLYVTASGDVVLNKVVTNDSVRQGERRLSRTRRPVVMPQPRQRQGLREMCRDILGCIFVIICSIIVLLTDSHVAKFVDPIISIISALVLLVLSFPYMKESCLILLQTIPDTINIDNLRSQLIKQFPDIVNVHDLHVWQLTAQKVISTAHIVFKNPREYAKITDAIKEFFQDHGITQVTIQPEFYIKDNTPVKLDKKLSVDGVCLMKCQSEGCKNSACCPQVDDNKSPSNKSSRHTLTDDLKSVKVEKQIKVSTTNIATNEEPKVEEYSKNEESKEIVLFALFLTGIPKQSSACNGYVFKLHYIKPCGTNDVLAYKNGNVEIDKDCNIIPQGCIVTSGFKSAMIHYRAEKKPMPALEGDLDLCKALADKNEYVLLATGALGLPQSCPVDKYEKCGTGESKVNISKYKGKLGMALGVSEVNVTITHDSGESCITLKCEFTKPRRRG